MPGEEKFMAIEYLGLRGQRRAALLIFHRSRQVTLGDVGDFVRHN